MYSSGEFREYAEECLDWACTACSDQERDIFLEMAKTWFEAAVRARNAVRAPDARADIVDGGVAI